MRNVYRKGGFLLILVVLTKVYLFSACTQPAEDDNFRVIILTDMTHDDGNSLIRFLYYAPLFDLEAMIVTNQLPDFNYNDTGPWEKAMGILEAYKSELPQLRKHDSRFPSYEELLAVTHRGQGALPIIWLTNDLFFSGQIAGRMVESRWDSIRFHDWIGEGLTPHGTPKDSPGSEFLQEVFAREDDRPIYVQAWGGTIAFVQALYRYRQRQGEERFMELLPKIRLYGILFQDISFEYFASFMGLKEKSCPWFGTAVSTYDRKPVDLGLVLFDAGHFWHYCCSADPDWIRPIYAADVNGHGPMSEIYDNGGEGDTPAFLYLLSAIHGLNDPSVPTQGSWGSMFRPIEGFPLGYYHTCNISLNELTRWIPDATTSFKNRLLWSVKEPGEVNREPIAVINNDTSRNVLHITGRPGEIITLDASASSDPDGDSLTFNWFRYNEADNYTGVFVIDNPGNPRQQFTIPDDLDDQNIHLVLEVRDNGTPRLVSYRRIIINQSV
jgi:hypothetical protein